MMTQTHTRNSTITKSLFSLVAALGLVARVGTPVSAESNLQLAETEHEVVGGMTRTKGHVSALASNQTCVIKDGSEVIYQDRIFTGQKSQVEFQLVDESVITLGNMSDFLIDEMVYDPADNKSSVTLRLAGGVFRMVSGKINKVPGGYLTLITPIATIGVHGADFWGLQEANKLTMVLIDNGALEISNGSETVTLTEPLSGVVVQNGVATIQRISVTPQELAAAAETISV
jgi:hypothetical protein